jgi:hypothetical protein
MTMEGHTDEPPAYRQTPRRHRILGAGRFRHEHRYVLQDKSGRDWVSFRIKSRAADPKNTPLFFEGDTIRGEVQLDLAKAKTLKGLTITVRALPATVVPSSQVRWRACLTPCPKGSRGDDGCGPGRGTVLGYYRARVDACIDERRQSCRAAQVPVFHHAPARRHDRARTQGSTKVLLAPAYILGARKSRIHRLQTILDCAPRQATGEQAVRFPPSLFFQQRVMSIALSSMCCPPRHLCSLLSVDRDFVRTGCQRTLDSSRALWRNRHLLYAHSPMWKVG